MKVLVVDDSLTARMFSKKCIKMCLPGEEIEFFEAADGEDALKKLRQNHVDIILSDVNMPIMSGFTFMRNLKIEQDLADIPVIFITSLANTARIENLIQLGASEVISKPIKPQELATALKKIQIQKAGNNKDSEEWGG